MSRLLSGDHAGLSLPGDLQRLREAIGQAESAEALEPLYSALARRHPVALLDLVIGPRAASSPAAVRAALGVAGVLEQRASPAALYKRLLEIQPETRGEVIAEAAARNPAASWLVQLSDTAEDVPGVTHLKACVAHPAFPAICWAHASVGHHEALVEVAASGRAEPAAALLHADRRDLAVEAAARALDAAPQSPVVPYLAAVGGPGIEPLLMQLVPRLKSAQAATALQQALVPFPGAAQLLASVLPGMR